MAQLKVTQRKSEIGGTSSQRNTLRSLGLKRIGDVVVKEDRPEIRGMVNTVSASFEGGQMPLHMRIPKLKGFKNPNKVDFQVVNVATINKLFPEGGDVTVSDLVAKGAVRSGQPVKVLGQGEISVAVTVTANKFSSSARDKIDAAGGSTIEL